MRFLKSTLYIAVLLTLSVLLSMVVPAVVDWVPGRGREAPRQGSTDGTVNNPENASVAASVRTTPVDPRPPHLAATATPPGDRSGCTTLPLSSFGDPGDAVGKSIVPAGGSVCYSVTTGRAGLHRVLLERHFGNAYALVFDGATQLDCYDPTAGPGWCELPRAGEFTVKVANYGKADSGTSLAVVPLADTTGCRGGTDTSWATPATTGSVDSAVELECQPFTAEAGERIAVDFPGEGWITDPSGARICPRVNADESDGCVLPGTGPYRVIARVRESSSGFPAAYTLGIRRLSDPSGCEYSPLNAYNSPPTPPTAGAGCKIFPAPAAGSYEIHRIDPAGVRSGVKVYDRAGKTVCKPWGQCTLPAAGDYTLVTSQATFVYDHTSSAGCQPGSLGNHLGDIDATGEVDCLALPLAPGARLAALGNRGAVKVAPQVRVVDADGVQRCDGAALEQGTCGLTGKGPHRALITAAGDLPTTGAYALALYRTDTAENCTVLPAGDFSATTAAAALTTGDGVFSHCLTIPAGDHSIRENLQIHAARGPTNVTTTVVDTSGTKVCALRPAQYANATCVLAPGTAYTVLVSGEDATGTYTLTRRDVTATAKGCIPNPATAVGGPSTIGRPGEPGTLHCRQVTTADARDTLHLNARDGEATTYTTVHGDDGTITTCRYSIRSCAVTGSTSYQVIVTVPQGSSIASFYRFDALRIGTAAGPAPECLNIADVSQGFGPLTGTLTEQRTALCAVLPTGRSDRFDADITTGTDASEPGHTAVPALYGSALKNGCAPSRPGAFQCSTREPTTGPAPATILVLGLPESASQTSYRVSFSCRSTSCGREG
ncbi:hypothetical protein [Streptomyces albipurpureus]|uniref:Uncharacterized protein n=1 Tax=Streptomyces albipurpureus TaxID=2897419 RepID=A0ABT0ULI7_9ACTN|nr:hypothetical protein [Streptomyces sp. CWNU-1]MCM2388970.1 hypothetical protein [Streptomyces sp. CWNU-1]